MNWDAIGTIAEVAGAVAVVLTLLYLAIQIRQSTTATRAGTSSYIDGALARILAPLRDNPEFAAVWLKGCKDLESLDEIERLRFTSHLLDMLNLAEHIHQLEKQGLSGTHIDYIPWLSLLYRDNPGIRSFLDLLDNVGSAELTERIKDVRGARGTNIFEAQANEGL